MRYEIHVAPPARHQLASLDAWIAIAVQRAIELRLTRHPSRPNRWIRALWDADGPQFCLRVGPSRTFYDVEGSSVHVLAVAMLREPGPTRGPRAQGAIERIPLAIAKKRLSEWMRQARLQPVLITRHGRAAALLVGFETEDDWLEYRMRRQPGFLAQVRAAREGGVDGRTPQ